MRKIKPAIVLICTIAACLLAPLSIPLPEVPFTMQTFVLFLIAALFGRITGVMVCLLYLLIGAAGIPVFGGFTGGFEKLYGPTAGFLWAFPVLSYLLGWLAERGDNNFFYVMGRFFIAHLLLLIPGFLVLDLARENIDLWQTFLKLMPGLFIKSIFGGIIVHYLVSRIPASWTTVRREV